MPRNERHVVPNPKGGWDVEAPNAERASSHHDTQAEAIDRARQIVHNTGGGVVARGFLCRRAALPHGTWHQRFQTTHA